MLVDSLHVETRILFLLSSFAAKRAVVVIVSPEITGQVYRENEVSKAVRILYRSQNFTNGCDIRAVVITLCAIRSGYFVFSRTQSTSI